MHRVPSFLKKNSCRFNHQWELSYHVAMPLKVEYILQIGVTCGPNGTRKHLKRGGQQYIIHASRYVHFMATASKHNYNQDNTTEMQRDAKGLMPGICVLFYLCFPFIHRPILYQSCSDK
jgi:hypothetical protein